MAGIEPADRNVETIREVNIPSPEAATEMPSNDKKHCNTKHLICQEA